VDEQAAADIREAIESAERASFEHGRFSWGYGNILGGLTSIEEKSYGCLAKSGTKPLQGVLKTFVKPPRPGYWVQVGEPGSGTFHGDPEGINQFAACGSHIGLFTTGCGSTTGGLIPVIKIIANTHRMQLIADNADLDATPVIRGEQTIKEMGEALYQEILAVAAGKLTKSEVYRHYEA
jgi:altronate dehydratase large subunit